LAIVGLERPSFDLDAFMEMCNWDVESALNMYFANSDELVSLVGPASTPKPSSQTTVSSGSDVVLSCGHVEANLESQHLQIVLDFIEFIVLGAVTPSHVDGAYGEYVNDNFTLMINMADVQKMK